MQSTLKTSQQGYARVLLLPFPEQGHVAPIMKLGHQLASYGVKVTLLTSEFIHMRMDLAASSKLDAKEQELVRIVSVPDGLSPEDDREDQRLLVERISQIMPGHLESLMKEADTEDGNTKSTCIIADFVFGWALKMAGSMGLKRASFFVSSPGLLAMTLQIPKLIEAGFIDADDGTAIKSEKYHLSPNLPPLDNADYLWNCPKYKSLQKNVFRYSLFCTQNLKFCEWFLCNWFHELDPSAVDLLPNIVAVGPLLAGGQSVGNLWSEDSTCLSWLDKQSPRSVIYIAFGSTTKVSQHQFDELALGLELIGLPFLWVVRSNLINGAAAEYPDGFMERTTNLGKVVQWAPQEKVLAHPSVACFLTHCGWNSTMEAICMGVPMLCWPYCTDQLYNRTCVCYGWKNGMELNPDGNEVVTRHELKKKVEALVSDEAIRANALKWKELAQKSIAAGGSSSKNLEDFIAGITI